VKDAVLVRPPWNIRAHRLVRFEPSEWFLPRGALVAELTRGGVGFAAVATHLGLRPVERIAHARELVGLLGPVGHPVIVGGDLNERPDGRASAIIAERLRDAWLVGGDRGGETFPASAPTARIDYLFVSEPFRVERVLVPADDRASRASDHRPVVAELTVPAAG
jgi:endonuclease/exonuclease/phosphatase family metal-dependent hydrolase